MKKLIYLYTGKMKDFNKNKFIIKNCKNYDNWCEKEKRSCKYCYYENLNHIPHIN